MKHTDAHRVIAMVAVTCLGFALGCSDPKPDGAAGGAGTGGAGGSATGGSAGAAGATGGAGGGTGGAGGAGGGSADGGLKPDEACAHLAAVTCQRYSECLLWYVPANFGDIDTCVKQYTTGLCLNRVGIEDSSDSPALNEACAAARKAATCAEWFDNHVSLSVCLPQPGPRATGSTCSKASQCQTTNCEILPDAPCGTCGGPLAGEGGRCTSSDQCASNLQCFDGVCGLPRGLGEPCSTSGACQFALQCINGFCAVPAKAGESCVTTPCRSRDGLSCVNGVCEAWQFVGTGERCSNFGPFCARNGDCVVSGGSSEGICVAGAAVGERCNNLGGPLCMFWASCIGGVCKEAEFGACK